MHDEKLARGLARQLLRNVKSLTDFEGGPFVGAYRPTIGAYLAGGVSNVVTAGLSLQQRIVGAGPFPCSASVIPHPTRKRMVVETISPRVIGGSEQEHLICAGYVFDLGRTELGLIETSLHTAISHHTLTRLFQRSSFAEAHTPGLIDIVTRFVTPVLFGMNILGWGPDMGVAIPYRDGLLLGSTDVNFLAADQGPTLTTFRRNHASDLDMLTLPFDISHGDKRALIAVGIETFLGGPELHGNQEAIRDDLIAICERFGPQFQALRTGMMRGYPDSRMRERFGAVMPELSKDELFALGVAMTRFFETPEWARQAKAHGARAAAIRRRTLH